MSHCERCLKATLAAELEPFGPWQERMCGDCREAFRAAALASPASAPVNAGSSSSSSSARPRRPYEPPRIDESVRFGNRPRLTDE
jgi:hypothetical protein